MIFGISESDNCEMQSLKQPNACKLHEVKARQSSKIRCLSESLIAAGFVTLDDQAKVLGLPRSTAFSILRSSHKGSGLSASTINRMLSSPRLPSAVRVKLIEYVNEKAAGLYGHKGARLRKFNSQFAADVFRDRPMKESDRPQHSCDHDQEHRGRRESRRRN